MQLPRSIIEFYYKNDKLNDPMVSEEHITAFGWATPQEIDEVMSLALRINDFLVGLFLGIGIRLVDFKVEFGRLWEQRADAHRAGRRDQPRLLPPVGHRQSTSWTRIASAATWAACSRPIRRSRAAWASDREPAAARHRAGACVLEAEQPRSSE